MRAIPLVGVVALCAMACARQTRAPSPAAAAVRQGTMPPDSLQPARDSSLRVVAMTLAGRELAPAESVFRNIGIARGVPAGRLPLMMNSMARSLGVTCTFCHDLSDFSSDVKPAKLTARRMYAMMRNLNAEVLPRALERSPSQTALVTCATCHRGDRRPVTELPR